MPHNRLTTESSVWALRLLAIATATLLVLLACESSEDQEDNDPANVVDAVADFLLPCFPHKPCPSGWTCVGGACLKSDSVATGNNGGSDTSGGGGDHTPWKGGVPQGVTYHSSRGIPCQAPIALAFDGSYLWCVDVAGAVARRFSKTSSVQSATAKLPSGNMVDIASTNSINQLNAAGPNGYIWRLRTNLAAAQLMNIGAMQGISYDRNSGQVLTYEGNSLIRRNQSSFSSTKVTSFPDSGCARLAWSNDYAFRWCGTAESGNDFMHQIGVYDMETAPTASKVRTLGAELNATGTGGLEVNGSTLWLIGAGSGSDASKLFQYTIY